MFMADFANCGVPYGIGKQKTEFDNQAVLGVVFCWRGLCEDVEQGAVAFLGELQHEVGKVRLLECGGLGEARVDEAAGPLGLGDGIVQRLPGLGRQVLGRGVQTGYASNHAIRGGAAVGRCPSSD